MTREYFNSNVIRAIEIESEDGGRHWTTRKGSEVQKYLDNLGDGMYFSDMDYSTDQDDPEIQEVLDAAIKLWSEEGPRKHFETFDAVIDFLLNNEHKQEKAKKVWTEEQIKELIQTNDKVLYGALRKLYAEQTADEQRDGETKHRNGVGFNGADGKFLTSVAQFLSRTGFLTDKQKAVTRRKLVKYNKQLTKLANA